MVVNEWHKKPMGMSWGVIIHRYLDGSAAIKFYDYDGRGAERSFTVEEIGEIILTLEGELGCKNV